MHQPREVALDQHALAASITVEAEDALVAALRVKHEHPAAMITYVRKSNQRGDRRHPHETLDGN